MQQEFAARAARIVEKDENVVGLAVAGSWITSEMDEYSDVDLVVVTNQRIGDNKEKMMAFARRLGDFISGFTGEHVGETRLLICLYDNPLLHVDIKFVTAAEFKDRVENPVVLFERDSALTDIIKSTKAEWPAVHFQWIEDRFWTWIHYLACKVARGELFECIDGLGFIRAKVLTPLMQVKAKKMPRGVRKAEMQLNLPDLENLKITLPQYDKASVVKAIDNCISIYRSLRRKLYSDDVELQSLAEKRSIEFFKKVKS